MTIEPMKNEWINKMWYLHTTEYCLLMEKNELLTQATTPINLQNTMLKKMADKK